MKPLNRMFPGLHLRVNYNKQQKLMSPVQKSGNDVTFQTVVKLGVFHSNLGHLVYKALCSRQDA